MSSDQPAEREQLRAALGPGKDCLSIEDLERCLDGSATGAPVANLTAHLEACPHCRTELHLLREFQSGRVREEEAAAVGAVARQLRIRATEIFDHPAELPG